MRLIVFWLKEPTSTRSAGHFEVSLQTYQRWRAQNRAMRPEDVVWLQALEKENVRLKRIVGEQALDIDMLTEVARWRTDNQPELANDWTEKRGSGQFKRRGYEMPC